MKKNLPTEPEELDSLKKFPVFFSKSYLDRIGKQAKKQSMNKTNYIKTAVYNQLIADEEKEGE